MDAAPGTGSSSTSSSPPASAWSASTPTAASSRPTATSGVYLGVEPERAPRAARPVLRPASARRSSGPPSRHLLLPRPRPEEPAADRLAPPRPGARPGAAPRAHHAPLQPRARVRPDARLPQQLPRPRGRLAAELDRHRQRVHHRARAAREPADARRLHLDLPPRRRRPEHALRAAARDRRAARAAQPRGARAGGLEGPWSRTSPRRSAAWRASAASRSPATLPPHLPSPSGDYHWLYLGLFGVLSHALRAAPALTEVTARGARRRRRGVETRHRRAPAARSAGAAAGRRRRSSPSTTRTRASAGWRSTTSP